MAERKLKPTEIFDVESIRHPIIETTTESQLKYKEIENGGKWLMFINKSKLDEVWEKCCKLYDEGQLTGVSNIRSSTNYKIPKNRFSNKTGVIRFYCVPSANNETEIMEIGKNILKLIPYQSDSGYMTYKSDEQTKRGTRQTGQKINHLYKLEVPRRLPAEDFDKMIKDFAALKTGPSSTKKDFTQNK
ncbi:uncharacterized protein LOC123293675 [Chrysoperla carnea]|uniref:uncharacterized protein LOC123293675 n=1 Tax=Chrysoperla carnea TaxID=189513 RepID=UPI001D06041C|nr:uncharacterized protein LOC123293675 [Chrysoperla carnea]